MSDKKVILLVDDEELMSRAARRLLAPEGYLVEVADSGEAALELLKAQHFDLVVTDYIMPGGMDGSQLARQVIDTYGYPVIILSASHDTPGQRDKMPPEATLLRKPEDLLNLGEHIANLISRQD